MNEREDETLEDYLERFQYNLQRSKLSNLGKESLRTILLRGIREYSLEVMNLIGIGDVSKFKFDDICELCRRYLRGSFRSGKELRDAPSRFTKSIASTGVTRNEICNLFENFKTDILISFNSQLDAL